MKMLDKIAHFPIEFGLVVVAIAGAIARYLNGYASGTPFKITMFAASVFASGFSGVIFGFIGISMALPDPILFIMAGTGGFFADQAMKYALEWVTKKAGK